MRSGSHHHGRPFLAVLGLSALALGATPDSAARVAPDPLPAWSTLAGTQDQVLYDVADLIGNFWEIHDGMDVYVWDLAVVGDGAGNFATLRYEFQTPDDELLTFDSDLSEWVSGTTEISAISDITEGSYVYYTDPGGWVSIQESLEIGDGAIGPGGVIEFPGLGGEDNCSPSAGILTCGNNCHSLWGWQFGACTMTGSGQCACQNGTCPFVWSATTCEGTCEGGSCSQLPPCNCP